MAYCHQSQTLREMHSFILIYISVTLKSGMFLCIKMRDVGIGDFAFKKN